MNLGVLAALSNGFIISPIEAIFYITVVTLYALAGRPLSCLINTFAFTFYWGFMALLSKATESGLYERVLPVYVACGIGIYILVNIASLREGQKKARVFVAG